MNPQFEAFNKLKKQAESVIILGGILIGLGILAMLALMYSLGQAGQIVGFIIIAIGMIVSGVGSGKFKKVSRSFKDLVLIKVMKEILPDTMYNPDAGLDESTVYRTECLKRADRYHSEDLITGSIENVAFRCSDVRMEERHVQHTKNGTRVYYVPYFVGRIFEFTFNKEFEGYLQVLEAGSPISNRPFKKIQLESMEFNKKFRTFSTTELSAFYVLTPDFMEEIMKLESRNPGRISFSFTGATLYIAINNNRDTFELRLFKTIDDSIVEEFKQDLLVIKDIITSLKLNQKIFKN